MFNILSVNGTDIIPANFVQTSTANTFTNTNTFNNTLTISGYDFKNLNNQLHIDSSSNAKILNLFETLMVSNAYLGGQRAISLTSFDETHTSTKTLGPNIEFYPAELEANPTTDTINPPTQNLFNSYIHKENGFQYYYKDANWYKVVNESRLIIDSDNINYRSTNGADLMKFNLNTEKVQFGGIAGNARLTIQDLATNFIDFKLGGTDALKIKSYGTGSMLESSLVRIQGELEVSNKTNFQNIINIGSLASEPTNSQNGDMYFNSIDNKLRFYMNGWKTVNLIDD